MNSLTLSKAVERALVERNPRNMALVQAVLRPGYCQRAATFLRGITGTVIIGTGFPVKNTFETDGPAGAMTLYTALKSLGAKPVIACSAPLSDVLGEDYDVLELTVGNAASARATAAASLHSLQPEALVAIECPGAAADGRYYNMYGQDITARCAHFDPFIAQAACPTIAIGDGGNEIGMGNVGPVLEQLDIHGSVTPCTELVVADVSNWGAYALVALLGHWAERDLLGCADTGSLLRFLCRHGGADGITGENTPTEDGLDSSEGQRLVDRLQALLNV